MKNEIIIQARTFPVTVRDQRTGEQREDLLTLDKRQLQAAQLVGQSSNELIFRIYNRQGFYVLNIGKPIKREVRVDLASA